MAPWLVGAVAVLTWAQGATAQLGNREAVQWTTPTAKGPDQEVPGWLINLGPTGIRAMLQDKGFEVRYVFPNSPAVGRVEVGDRILGVNGREFSAHQWKGTHGYDGPMREFGDAIEFSESSNGDLQLIVRRESERTLVMVPIPAIGAFSPTFPFGCAKSKMLRKRALDYIARTRLVGWGAVHSTAICGLALLSSDDPAHRDGAKRLAQKWGARRQVAGMWSWALAYRLVFLSEYYLATQADFVRPGIEALIRYSEGIMHPQFGGFGHKVQPEGYGPMVLPTGLMLMGWELAEQCGFRVDADAKAAALGFVRAGTGLNGYVAYGTEWRGKTKGSGSNHLGRAGACVLSQVLSSDPGAKDYVRRGANFLGEHRAAFADGHAENILHVCWSLLGCGASGDSEAFRAMLDDCKAWFNLARTHDGSFVALPGRDYIEAGGSYYHSSRDHLTAALALVFAHDSPRLRILGSKPLVPGVDAAKLTGKLKSSYRQLERGQFGKAWKTLSRERKAEEPGASPAQPLLRFIEKRVEIELDRLAEVERSGDRYGLKRELEVVARRLIGIPEFDEQLQMWKELMRGSKWRAELHAGKNYYALVASVAAKPSTKGLEKLERFARQHGESPYGAAATHAVEHLRSRAPGDPGQAYFRKRLR